MLLDPDKLKVGDPITKELLDQINEILTDHEDRINSGETTGGSVYVLNQVFNLAGLPSYDPFVFYYKATQNFSINEFRAQIFDKGSISTGVLAFDLQKSSDTDDDNFNTVLSSDLSFNYASDSSFSEKVASLNSSLTDVEAGDVLRVEVKSMPSNFGGKVLLIIGAE